MISLSGRIGIPTTKREEQIEIANSREIVYNVGVLWCREWPMHHGSIIMPTLALAGNSVAGNWKQGSAWLDYPDGVSGSEIANY